MCADDLPGPLLVKVLTKVGQWPGPLRQQAFGSSSATVKQLLACASVSRRCVLAVRCVQLVGSQPGLFAVRSVHEGTTQEPAWCRWRDAAVEAAPHLFAGGELLLQPHADGGCYLSRLLGSLLAGVELSLDLVPTHLMVDRAIPITLASRSQACATCQLI